jgi:hypothetical protein
MPFSATWFLLEQEGLLAQACLCNGLTALRRANRGERSFSSLPSLTGSM